MKTILHPSDFSQNASRALPYALDLAKRMQAQVSFLHVHELPILAPENPQAAILETQSAVEEARQYAHEKLSKLISTINLAEAPHRTFIRGGYPADEIGAVAEEIDAAFIVMGTAGANAHRGFLMGSVAAQVIRSVEMPVLVVPNGATFKPFKSLVFATDLTHEEPDAIRAMVDLARLYDATLTFLHINQSSKSPSHDPKKYRFSEILKLVDYPKASYRTESMEDIVAGIDRFVTQNNCDLIGLCTHTRGLLDRLFHRSIAKQLVLHSHVPVITFHQK